MHRYLFIFTLLLATTGWAQSQEYFRKVKSVQIENGKPFEVEFEDGTVIEARQKIKSTVFKVPMTLSENSCNTQIGLKCVMHTAVAQDQKVMFWKVHPTKAGIAVNQSTGGFNAMGDINTYAADDSRFPKLRQALKSYSSLPPALEKFQANQIVWLECEEPLSEDLPKQILYWDQNFESGNEEITMDSRQFRSVNKMTSRHRNIVLQGTSKEFSVFTPKLTLTGNGGGIPGFAYQIQWTIQAPNLIEPEKPVCQLKWDIAFGALFTQFSAFFNFQDSQTEPKASEFHPFIYSSEYSRMWMFKKEYWQVGRSSRWLN